MCHCIEEPTAVQAYPTQSLLTEVCVSRILVATLWVHGLHQVCWLTKRGQRWRPQKPRKPACPRDGRVCRSVTCCTVSLPQPLFTPSFVHSLSPDHLMGSASLTSFQPPGGCLRLEWGRHHRTILLGERFPRTQPNSSAWLSWSFVTWPHCAVCHDGSKCSSLASQGYSMLPSHR